MTPIDPDVEILKLTTARTLADLAVRTGDRAFDRAAGALMRRIEGRPRKNDDLIVREALQMVESGEARSLNAAFHRLAKRVHPYKSAKSIVERLRRKARALDA